MMSRSTLIIGIGLAILFVSTISTEAQVPHTVMGQVFNSDVSIPAVGQLTFAAHLVDVSAGNASSETRTQSDPGNAYGNGIMGAGWYEVECANFDAFDWTDGDSLVVLFTNSANGQMGRLAVALFSDQEPQVAADVTLHQALPGWSISLEDFPDSVWAGEELTYTIRYRNCGLGFATGVTIVDTIPSSVEYQSCTGGGSHIGREITWTVGTVSPDDSGSVTLTVTVDSPLSNGTLLHNRAHITCGQGVSGTASEISTVRSAPQWSFSLSDSPDAVEAGEYLTYTIYYQNTGSDGASGVTITDTIPQYTTYSSNTGGGQYDGQRVVWATGTVSAGASGSVTLTVLVDWPLLNGTDIDNRASIDSDQGAAAFDDETTSVSPDLSPPSAATDLLSTMEGGQLQLNWSSIVTDIYGQADVMQGYLIYRDDTPFFAPTPSESLDMVTDTFFVDGGSRVGDSGSNSFYLIRGMDYTGNVGINSNRVGEIDYRLPCGSSGYTMISNSLDDGTTVLANQLGARVPCCTAVKEWDAAQRAYVSKAFKVDDTWYGSAAVSSGYPYHLFISASPDSLWTLTGRVPADPVFQLVAPTGNDYNTITLPLSSDIALARDLGATIPHCTAVKKWNECTQGYVSLAFKVGQTWYGTGSVQRGYPYYVNVTSGSTWPAEKAGTGEMNRASKNRL
jgi:uncharacterized repeat protein (TIGR01451 family)